METPYPHHYPYRTIAAVTCMLLIVLFLSLPPAFAASGINRQINFQGKLVNTDGTNVADATYTIVFSLYTVSSGGANIWTESDSVTTKDGVFQVQLGATTSFASASVDFNQTPLYLGIKVNSDAEMTPRVQFAAVPYALNAEKVSGLTVTNNGGNTLNIAANKTLTANNSLTLAGTDGKTFTLNNSLTFNGTDGNTFTFPNASGSTICVSGQTCATSGTVGYFQRTASGGLNYLAPATIADNLSIGATTGLTNAGLSVKVNSLGNAAAYVENTGTGDIFTASSAGAPKFVIDENGNVGIGTTTPTTALYINRTTTQANMLLNNNNNVQTTFTFSDNTNGANFDIYRPASTRDLRIYNETVGNDIMSFTSAGSIGIGAGLVAPLSNSILHVGGNSKGNAALVADNTGGSGDLFTASSAGTPKFVINSAGNVGIGTTTPGRTLDITGNWGGNEDDNAQSNTSGTVNDSTKALVYNLSENKTSGNAQTTTTFNLTGLPNTNGTFAYVVIKASHNAGIGTSAQQCVQLTINNSPSILITNMCDTVGNSASTWIKQFIVWRVNNGWDAFNSPTSSSVLSSFPDTADLAEWIATTGVLPKAGEIISIGDTTTAHLSDGAYDHKVAGIVSTNPNTVYGQQTNDSVAMALAGRIPAIVTSLNGDIQSGDMITSSPIAGVGMLPSQSAFTVGKALEIFRPGSQVCTQVSSYDAIIWPDDDGTNPSKPCFAIPVSSFDQTTQAVLVSAYGLHASDTIFVGKIMTLANLSYTEVQSQTEQVLSSQPGLIQQAGQNDEQAREVLQLLATDSAALTSDKQTSSLFGDTLFAGTIIADTIKANHIEGLDIYTNSVSSLTDTVSSMSADLSVLRANTSAAGGNIATLSGQMTTLSDLPARVSLLEKELPTLSASPSGSLIAEDATISGQLFVSGRTLLSDVGITGKIATGLLTINGLDDSTATPAASMNTLSGPLKLQSLALGGLDMLNGKVTIDTSGNVQIEESITAKKYTVSTQDTLSASAGQAEIPAGKTTVDITTSALTEKSLIFATPNDVIFTRFCGDPKEGI